MDKALFSPRLASNHTKTHTLHHWGGCYQKRRDYAQIVKTIYGGVVIPVQYISNACILDGFVIILMLEVFLPFLDFLTC